jgi:hypothetical protein
MQSYSENCLGWRHGWYMKTKRVRRRIRDELLEMLGTECHQGLSVPMIIGITGRSKDVIDANMKRLVDDGLARRAWVDSGYLYWRR